MKTITIREYRDRDGRTWFEVPFRHGDQLEHVMPDGTVVTAPRAVLVYLAGSLVEVP